MLSELPSWASSWLLLGINTPTLSLAQLGVLRKPNQLNKEAKSKHPTQGAVHDR